MLNAELIYAYIQESRMNLEYIHIKRKKTKNIPVSCEDWTLT